jgi:signal transduction histidine kinase
MKFNNVSFYHKSLFTNIRLAQPGCSFIFLIGFFAVFSCKQSPPNKILPSNNGAKAIITKVRSLISLNQPDRAMAYLDSAYAAFPNPGILDIRAKYHEKAYYYLNYKKAPHTAQLYLDSMFDILKGRELEFRHEYLDNLMTGGDIAIGEKDYEKAIQFYYQGSLFAQKNLDSCSAYELTSRQGLVRYRQGNYLKAVPYFKKSMDDNNYCGGSKGDLHQWNLNTIGLCFEKAGVLDSAVYYYKKDLSYIDSNVNLFSQKDRYAEAARGIVYGNLGGTYVGLKDYGQAEKYLKASISINDRIGYYQDDAKTAQLKLADLYLKLSRFKEVNNLLQKIENDLKAWRAKGQNEDDLLIRLFKLKWKYFDKMHNTPEAYSSYISYHSLNDSLNESNKNLSSVDLDEGLKETEQQYKIDLLSKSDQLKSFYLFAAILFSALILVILAMFWYNLKQSKRNVGKLTGLNQIISDYNSQLQHALTALEESYEENSNLMQVVAHDLRAPIGGIAVTAAKMLEQSTSPGERATLEMIVTSAKDSLFLVSDLLKNYTSVKDFKTEPVDMYALLEHCIAIMRVKAEEKSQRIELDAGYFTVYVNREKMWRVIVNLIANAIKFSPTGAVIRVTMLKREDKVLIAVDDNGIGIPLNMRDKVFDMFTEAKRPGTYGEQPFGIGLAISKQIVEMHGGKIWFENEPPNGTTMYVELPYEAAV